MILGMIGVLWACLGPGVIILAHYTGIEKFEAPPWNAIGFIVLDTCITIVYEYTLARATSYIGPLTSNVSLAAIIPLTMIVDYFWSVKGYSIYYYLASLGII